MRYKDFDVAEKPLIAFEGLSLLPTTLSGSSFVVIADGFTKLNVSLSSSVLIAKRSEDQRGGRTARQVGHSSFTSIQCVRQSLWNKWLQGVTITVTSSINSSPTPLSFSSNCSYGSAWNMF